MTEEKTKELPNATQVVVKQKLVVVLDFQRLHVFLEQEKQGNDISHNAVKQQPSFDILKKEV